MSIKDPFPMLPLHGAKLNPSAASPLPGSPVIFHLSAGNDPLQRTWKLYFMEVLQKYRKAVAKNGLHSCFEEQMFESMAMALNTLQDWKTIMRSILLGGSVSITEGGIL